MKKNRLSNKQKIEIKCLDYFKLKRIKIFDISFNDTKTDYANYLYSKYFAQIPQNLTKKPTLLKVYRSKDGLSPEEAYFKITDSGVKKVLTTNIPRLVQLLISKKWRLRMMEMYEDTVLEGSVPYITILSMEPGDTKIPEYVMKFLSKTMFKGLDKFAIESLYYGRSL